MDEPETEKDLRFIHLDLVCIGTDIFDLTVCLEAWYDYDVHNVADSFNSAGQQLDIPPDAVLTQTALIYFWPAGGKVRSPADEASEVPNPVKKGQQLTFELTRSWLRDMYASSPNATKISELPHSRVSIAIASGKGRFPRILDRIPRRRFAHLLRRLDA
jgi:hypothetical protein